jgi:hypothetical protein
MAAGTRGPNIFLSFHPAERTSRVPTPEESMMTTNDFPTIAGSASTVIFVTSYMPMLAKALRTKDLSSYSPTQLVLTNFGNVLYSAYVFSLPVGPIWALHSFYLVATALMLAWYVRYTRVMGRSVGYVDRTRARSRATIRALTSPTTLSPIR